MNAATGHALEQALAYYRAPAMLPVARERRLPDDVLDVLRIAAGDESLAAQLSDSTGEAQATVVDAAVFFVQQVLFAPGADSYRVLGVNTDAPDARIKENYRWLVRWLHPDRNLDDWDSVYAERVNRAWQDLRLPDRRAAYDAQRVAEGSGAASATAVPARPHGRLHDAGALADPLLSARTAQRLPAFVLGGLGLAAMSLLALMWFVADPPATTAPQARPAPSLDPDALRQPSPEPTPAAAPAVAVLPELAPTPAATAVVEPALPPASAVAAPAPVPARVAQVAPAEVAPAPVNVAPPVVAPAMAAAPAPAAAPPAARVPAAAAPPEIRAPRTAAPAARRTAVRSAPAAPPADAPANEGAAGDAPRIAAAAPAAAPVVPPVDRQQANAVLERFSAVYAAGDISGLMRLFTADARNNRGGRDAIVYDYQSLFSGTDQRSLRFVPVGWMQRDDDSATLLARYEASVTQPGKRRADRSSGQIRFDLRRENGQLMISQIRIENAD
jgi:hypothetical protein